VEPPSAVTLPPVIADVYETEVVVVVDTVGQLSEVVVNGTVGP
jgi:hypothetical protein